MKQREYRVFEQDVGRHGYSAFDSVTASSSRDAVRKCNLGRREAGLKPLDLIARLESTKAKNFGLEDHGWAGLYPRKRRS
jgi:hypothetical protein